MKIVLFVFLISFFAFSSGFFPVELDFPVINDLDSIGRVAAKIDDNVGADLANEMGGCNDGVDIDRKEENKMKIILRLKRMARC